MQRLRLSTLPRLAAPVLLAALTLSGCGNTISQIDGLPQTRDMGEVPWPMLVDTPAVPVDALLPETGARTLVALESAQGTALTRQASAGPARVETAALQQRVARIREQTSVRAASVDSADLSSRAARLAQARAMPSTGVAVDELRTRADRLAAVRSQGYGDIDGTDLQARANRVRGQTQTYYGTVDRFDLEQRSRRAASLESSVAPVPLSSPSRRASPDPFLPFDGLQLTEEGMLVEAVPEPAPKPAAPLQADPRRRDRAEPVVSTDFRARAREAVERARKRAAAPPPE